MKFIIFFLIFLFSISAKEDIFEIKLKNGTVIKTKNITEFKDRIEYISENKKQIYKRDEIESFRTVSEKEEDLRKTLLLNNKTYINGMIVFKNLKTVKLFNNGHITEISSDLIEDELKEKDFLNLQNKNKFKAFAWSTLFPGLGQYYTNGRMNWKSWSFITSTVLAAGIAGYYYNQSNIHYSRYEMSDYWNRSEYNLHKNSIHSYNNALGLLGFIWAVNMTDSYFNFNLKYEGYKTYEGIDRRTTVEFTVYRF